MLNVVDLSSNNGIVDVGALKRAGCEVVIIKATEGTNYVNPFFVSTVKQAIRLGLKLGFYHFYTGVDWKGNADHFYNIIKPYLKYGLALNDYEGRAITLGGVQYAKNFTEYLAKKLGYTPMIYMGLADENNYNWSSLVKTTDLWVAQYNNMSPEYGFHPRSIYGSLRHWRKVAMFQYTSTGSIGGYYPLDLSVKYGNWTEGVKVEMEVENWHAPVEYDDEGAFKVTQSGGAVLWSGANNDKKTDQALRGTVYRITKVKNGFYKIANHEQWLDGRTGQFKANPVAYNDHMHGKIVVVKPTAGHAELNTKVTGKDFKVGTAWKMSGYRTFKSASGKEWHWAIVGAGKDKYINLDKCRVIV